MKKTLTRLCGVLLSACAILGATVFFSDRCQPVRTDFGATWRMIEKEPKNNVDVLCIGASYAYCSTVPAVIYEESAVTAYNVCGPLLTMEQSYYYLRQALQRQTPRAVYVEATSMFFDFYTEYTKVNLGYLPYNFNRLRATFAAAEPAQRFGLLFPLYNYHDRIYSENLLQLFAPRADETADPFAGYTYLDRAQPQIGRGVRQDETVFYRPEAYAAAEQALEAIAQLCRERGIALSLYLAPAAEFLPNGHIARLQNTAKRLGIPLHNFNADDLFFTLGLDFATDFYDPRHLNANGAVKFSKAFAAVMLRDLGSASPSPSAPALWQARINALHARQNAGS